MGHSIVVRLPGGNALRKVDVELDRGRPLLGQTRMSPVADPARNVVVDLFARILGPPALVVELGTRRSMRIGQEVGDVLLRTPADLVRELAKPVGIADMFESLRLILERSEGRIGDERITEPVFQFRHHLAASHPQGLAARCLDEIFLDLVLRPAQGIEPARGQGRRVEQVVLDLVDRQDERAEGLSRRSSSADSSAESRGRSARKH